jgi:hypothetical protein
MEEYAKMGKYFSFITDYRRYFYLFTSFYHLFFHELLQSPTSDRTFRGVSLFSNHDQFIMNQFTMHFQVKIKLIRGTLVNEKRRTPASLFHLS